MQGKCEDTSKTGKSTNNWSPSKSPNATILPISSSPNACASKKAFAVNLLDGKGQRADIGLIKELIIRNIKLNGRS
jgi:hypothetical protein